MDLLHWLYINKPLKDNVTSKKFVAEEAVIIVAIVSLVPGLLLKIPGGSAVYFSYLQELLAVGILLGYDIVNKVEHILQTKRSFVRNIVKFSIVLFILVLCFNSRGIHSFINVVKIYRNTSNSNSLTSLRDTLEIRRGEKKQYCIYIEDNAEIWKIYKANPKVAVFFYPAITGIEVINGIYTDGKKIYSANGNYLSDKRDAHYYGVSAEPLEKRTDSEAIRVISKLTLEEAKGIAKTKGFKYIILFANDEHRIIDI